MDPSSYKKVTTKRGLKYNYYVSSGDPSKPTLLLIHGFPSTSYDWRHQIAFFKEKGYSIIAPDTLGYGGTDKPLDHTVFKYSSMSGDIVDILDAEKVDKAIVIGHDWGSILTTHLAVHHPDRFLAFAFLAVGYSPNRTGFQYEESMALAKQLLGYEPYGYWEFFASDGAERIIREHPESFFSLIHPEDPTVWKTDLCPRGGIKAWLLADRKVPLASYLTEVDKKIFLEGVANPGLASAVSYYKIMIHGIVAEDNKQILESRLVLQQPVFFGGTKLDYVCQPAIPIATMPKLCPNLTIKEWSTGHWLQLAAPEELNRELAEWIAGVEKAK